MLTPLGVGPGQPFPYISALSLSLGVLARDPETRRGALRPREGAGAAATVRRRSARRAAAPARRRDRPLPQTLFPGMEILERAVLPRHARRRHRALRRRRRPARGGGEEMRRRRFGDVVRIEVAARCRRRCSRAPRGLGVADAEIYPSTACSTSPSDADRAARPPGAEGRAVEAGRRRRRCAPTRRSRRLRGDSARRHLRPPPVRVVRRERRGFIERRVDDPA